MVFHANKLVDTYKEAAEICQLIWKLQYSFSTAFAFTLKTMKKYVMYSFCFYIKNNEEVCWSFEIVCIFMPYFNHFSYMANSYSHLIMYYPIMFLVIKPDR